MGGALVPPGGTTKVCEVGVVGQARQVRNAQRNFGQWRRRKHIHAVLGCAAGVGGAGGVGGGGDSADLHVFQPWLAVVEHAIEIEIGEHAPRKRVAADSNLSLGRQAAGCGHDSGNAHTGGGGVGGACPAEGIGGNVRLDGSQISQQR